MEKAERRKERKIPGSLKRAVFTVEAAVIIPLCVTITAALIGYCFYTHQINWWKGAAYESALKYTERGLTAGSREEAGKKRLKERLDAMPVRTGDAAADFRTGTKTTVTIKGEVLPDVFGSLFQYGTTAALMDFDPAAVKRLTFLVSSTGEK